MLADLKELESMKKYYEVTQKEGTTPHPLFWDMDYERLEFSDKPTYIAWRTIWRAAYADLSIYIHETKKKRSPKYYKEGEPNLQSYAQAYIASAAEVATAMLEQRRLSKLKAGTFYTKRVSPDIVDAVAYMMHTT